ncbi:MAG: hypothetical protein LAO55_23790 [Acidobacteriia bacterium]|nr:hypothetical protein [Terriglobia bacterium]
MNRSSWALFLLGSVLSGQNATQRSPDEEAEWVKIREVKAIYEDAVSSNQIEKLRPYIASNFHGVLVTGAEARSFDDLLKRNQEIRDLIGAGGSYKVAINYDPGTMFGNIAVANGTAEESIVTGGGKKFNFVSRWLVNMVKEDGSWKLYRFQATLDPVDNVFVQDTVKYNRMVFGGGALVIGALLGFVIRGFRR